MPVKDGLSMLEDSIEEYGYDAIIVSGYSDFEYARKLSAWESRNTYLSL